MSFIDKYYTIFNNSAGQHSVTISRAEFANLLGVFSKQEQQLDQLKGENEILKEKLVISSNSDKKTLKIIQTLAEIKEIAETKFNRADRYLILQKISEVLE